MRTRSSLERLAASGQPLLAQSDALVDAVEEDRIHAQIVSSGRSPAARRHRPPRAALVAAAVTVIVAASVVAGLELHRGAARVAVPAGHDQHPHMTLDGARIQMAGYHFRTPAGFTATDTACSPPASDGQPVTVLNSFASAASADGGCVEAFLLAPGSPTAPPATPADATPVAVGSYQGYYVPSDTTLYVAIPTANGPSTYLVLYAQGLTEDQLIAIAVSGLPTGSDSSNRVVHG